MTIEQLHLNCTFHSRLKNISNDTYRNSKTYECYYCSRSGKTDLATRI